jgi:hypothetical protein
MFSFRNTAPVSPGGRSFQWRMLQEGIAWFGDVIPSSRWGFQTHHQTAISAWIEALGCD